MSRIGVLSTDESVNNKVSEAMRDQEIIQHELDFFSSVQDFLEYLNFDLPEIVIINFSEQNVDLDQLARTVKNDAWLHNFGIIGLYDPEFNEEEELLGKYKSLNLLALLNYRRIPSHFVKSLAIIDANKQIIFQREITGRLMESTSGSLEIENDPLSVSIYAGILATALSQLGRIGPEKKMNLQLSLSELIINGVEHGNCGISFDEKTKALNQGLSVVELVAQKCEDPEILAKRVKVEWQTGLDESRFRIEDQGEGFDVAGLKDKLAEEGEYALHGRGIQMARMIAAKLTYNKKGNAVTLTVSHDSSLERVTPEGFSEEDALETVKGDIIFKEGEPSNFLYYIASGKFSVFHQTSHVGVLTPTDIFMGEMSFLLNNRRSATVRAESNGKLIKIDREAFVSVVKEYPHYGIFLSKLLARKLTRANVRSAQLDRIFQEAI